MPEKKKSKLDQLREFRERRYEAAIKKIPKEAKEKSKPTTNKKRKRNG